MYRQFHFWISFAGRNDRICRWSDDGVDESKAPSSEVKKLASMNNEKLWLGKRIQKGNFTAGCQGTCL